MSSTSDETDTIIEIEIFEDSCAEGILAMKSQSDEDSDFSNSISHISYNLSPTPSALETDEEAENQCLKLIQLLFSHFRTLVRN